MLLQVPTCSPCYLQARHSAFVNNSIHMAKQLYYTIKIYLSKLYHYIMYINIGTHTHKNIVSVNSITKWYVSITLKCEVFYQVY